MHPSGKVVLITGGSAGIGLATAKVFAAAGARLVLAARTAETLEAALRQLPGTHLAIPTDIANPAAHGVLVEQALRQYGRIDILIHNAGIGLAAPIAELRQPDLLKSFAVNLFGPVALTQAVLPHMRQQGSGQLIFVSSVVGLRSLPYLGGYAASKAAIDRLTEALRVELRGSGIAVTLFRPGTTNTGFGERRLGSGHEIRRTAPRGASPATVARAILRAAEREPRVAYTSWRDRLLVWSGVLFGGLTDRLLADSFTWQEAPEE
jgi:serine 3-dehydrogenase (NADP+)